GNYTDSDSPNPPIVASWNRVGTDADITELLRRWSDGDKSALDLLLPFVYPRLHAIAGNFERRISGDADLQATALVNEVFLKLVNLGRLDWNNREHFFAMAAVVMRQILVDHARARITQKRGGARQRVALHEDLQWVSIEHEEMLDLNLAMEEMAGFDSRKVR